MNTQKDLPEFTNPSAVNESLVKEEGHLVSKDGLNKFPIKNNIPRFVPESNYSNSFGFQWNKFRRTQLDSYSKINVSEISLDNTPVSGFPKGNSKTVAPSDTDTNKVEVNNKNELKTNAQVQVRLPDLKINTSTFKNENELLAYIGSFQTEVEAKQQEVKKLQRMFGNKKFGDLEKNIAGGIREKQND